MSSVVAKLDINLKKVKPHLNKQDKFILYKYVVSIVESWAVHQDRTRT